MGSNCLRFLAVALVLLRASPVFAWVQTCVPGTPPAGQLCLTWAALEMPVPYEINGSGSSDVEGDAEFAAAVRGFNRWPDAVGGCLCLQYTGKTMRHPDYSGEGDGANTVGWYESDWPYGREILALTTNLFSEEDGRIMETDMEMNGVDFTWAVLDAAGCGGSRSADVENIVSHEAGHFVGLAHSPVTDSTMYYRSGPGDCEKRDLHPDDLDGIAAIYPCPQPVAECSPPVDDDDDDDSDDDGDSATKGEEDENSCGCENISNSGGAGSAFFLAILVGAVGMRRRSLWGAR